MTTSNATTPTPTSYFAVVPKGLTDPFSSSSSSLSLAGPSSEPASRREHRFLRLPHPRSGNPGLYLVHDQDHDDDDDVTEAEAGSSRPHTTHRKSTTKENKQKILEVQSIDPERKRSWFYGDEVVSDGSLLVLTPINPKYLIIPLLLAHVCSSGSNSDSAVGTTTTTTSLRPGTLDPGSAFGSGWITDLLNREKTNQRTDNFLPLDDLTESLGRVERCRLSEPFVRTGKLARAWDGRTRRRNVTTRDEAEDEDEDDEMQGNEIDSWDGNRDVGVFLNVPIVRTALMGLCETQTIGAETYYRPSLIDIFSFLRKKLDDLSQEPIFDAQPSLKRGLVGLGLGHLLDEQVRHRITTTDEGDGVEVDVEVRVELKGGSGEEEVLKLARVRLAGEVLGQYLEPRIKTALMGSYDFDPLDKYLETQDSLMNAASRPITQSSGQEAFWDDMDPNAAKKKEAAAALKRKGSEKGSRAQESLKKVNTSKMPKLTTFFKKKTG